MRVFLDTNVLVSAHTTRGLSADLLSLILAEHELLTGEVNLLEFRRVLHDRFRVPRAVIARVERDLREHTVVPVPSGPVEVKVRDRDDQVVLASAIAGGAEVFVTGDKDLLEVAAKSPIPILTPRGAWALLRKREA